MPLTAIGWSPEEEQKLVQLVQPHPFLYNVHDPSRKNIIARECTWKEIAEALSRPFEECKKRWRCLRDSYMRSKRNGTLHYTRVPMFQLLRFLDEGTSDEDLDMDAEDEPTPVGSEQVITDNAEYFEITLLPEPPNMMKVDKQEVIQEEEVVKKKRPGGRKKAIPIVRNATPVKILPKPVVIRGQNGPANHNNGPSLPKIVKYIEENPAPASTLVSRSQTIDKLIERVLKENTNEIDVFFRSMAASVKKLQPSLIPKVKMEVCNVIAKYEMQSFDKNAQL